MSFTRLHYFQLTLFQNYKTISFRSVQIEELEDLSEKYRDLSWTIKMKEEDLNQRIAIAISEVKSFRGKMKRTFLSIID